MLYRKTLECFLADSVRARTPLDFRNYLSEIKEDISKLGPDEYYIGQQPRLDNITPPNNPRGLSHVRKQPPENGKRIKTMGKVMANLRQSRTMTRRLETPAANNQEGS